MSTPTTTGVPGAVFADEITEGMTVEAPCAGQIPIRDGNDGTRTGWVLCESLDRPHEPGGRHWATVLRLRRSPSGGLVTGIVRNEDGEEIPWRAHQIHEPVRVLTGR